MRTEADFWSNFIKRELHRPPGSVAWKVPAELRKGLPDVWTSCDLSGFVRTGWLELKYVPEWPAREGTGVVVAATPQQLAHLREAHEAGCIGAVVLGVHHDWFVLQEKTVRKQPEQRFTRKDLLTLSVGTGQIRDDALRSAIALL